MLEGFYTAASGILMQERTLNVVANNMANMDTPGFRSERVVSSTFEQTLLTCRENGRDHLIGKGAPIRTIEDIPTDFEENLLEDTGRPFDMALLGAGYFNIEGQDQTFLTRNGNFDVDDEGFLILRGTGRVLGEKGPIQVNGSYFTVEEDGTVFDQSEKMIDKILITNPQAPQAAAGTAQAQAQPLNKFSNGLYTAADPATNLPVTNVKVQQNTLERSNIDLNREYTLSMETMRNFQSCSAALRIIDAINEKSVSQIASIG